MLGHMVKSTWYINHTRNIGQEVFLVSLKNILLIIHFEKISASYFMFIVLLFNSCGCNYLSISWSRCSFSLFLRKNGFIEFLRWCLNFEIAPVAPYDHMYNPITFVKNIRMDSSECQNFKIEHRSCFVSSRITWSRLRLRRNYNFEE